MLRSHSWNGRVERLGLDEVFLDVTDVIAYNAELLNLNALQDSFFQLSRQDPEKGFSFDGSRFSGCVQPSLKDASTILGNPLGVRLMLASHLGGYLRHKLEEDFGYTSSGGISTNKTLAKLAGSVNKPKNQTTLLSIRDEDVQNFMDGHALRQVPGIGFRTAQLVQDHVLSTSTAVLNPHDPEQGGRVTVGQVRQHPSMSAELLERILDRPGAERGGGEKVWNLLHGVDGSEVKAASDVPTQISIEDTYMSRPLNTPAEVARELRALATSLVRRMRVDLVVEDTETGSQPRWAAYPKTLRLSTRTRPKPNATSSSSASASSVPESFSRVSRSQPLPSYVLNLKDDSVEAVAERLATEALLPLFRRLNPERQGWNLALINICVTNMVMVAGSDNETGNGSVSGGRNIASMFRTQEDKLREWTVYDTTPTHDTTADEHVDSPAEEATGSKEREYEQGGGEVVEEPSTISLDSDADAWEEEEESQRCGLCGHAIPLFAMAAHERFHTIGD
ncbi:DNA/RNA polymerase [Hypoxylon cercidicola]|nr:DNA/RNA polymerase [Hypoxylon cercidicola]